MVTTKTRKKKVYLSQENKRIVTACAATAIRRLGTVIETIQKETDVDWVIEELMEVKNKAEIALSWVEAQKKREASNAGS